MMRVQLSRINTRLQSLSTSKEFWIVLSSVMILTTAISWLGQIWPAFGGWSALLIALVFIYVPVEILERRGVSFKKMGIWRGALKSGFRNFFFVSLVVLPPYAVCFHYFQTNIEERNSSFEVRRLKEWPLEFTPSNTNKRKPEGFRIALKGDLVHCSWNIPEAKEVQLNLKGDESIRVQRGNVEAINDGSSLSVRTVATGSVLMHTTSEAITVSVIVDGKALPGDRMLDAYDQPLDQKVLNLDRDWWWFLHFLLGQLLLVALPEEIFYRGYLQSRLEQKFPKKSRFLRVDISWKALILTSTIFALGHVLTIPHPARLAVFFPSLLFGWMRAATGSIFSAVLFHVLCNLFAQVAFKFYI